MIRLVLNILWLVFGGLVSALAWFFGGLVLAITIVGLPWSFAAWRIGVYTLWPFGGRWCGAMTERLARAASAWS